MVSTISLWRLTVIAKCARRVKDIRRKALARDVNRDVNRALTPPERSGTLRSHRDGHRVQSPHRRTSMVVVVCFDRLEG
ncbi:MAG: hypothetical protein AABY89_11970 [Acidobacteriota bacterium]